jgi:hypothetical protein
MVWWILLGIGCLIAALLAVALIAPFNLHLRFGSDGSEVDAELSLSWISRHFIEGSASLRNRDITLRFLRFIRYAPGKKKAPPAPEDLFGEESAGGPGGAEPQEKSESIDTPQVEPGGRPGEPHDGTHSTANPPPSVHTDRSFPAPEPSAEIPAPEAQENEQPPGNEEPERKEKKPGILHRIRHSKVYFFLRQDTLRKKILRWIVRVVPSTFSIVAIRRVALLYRGPTPDPSLSGKLYGYCHAMNLGLQISRESPISLIYEPVFDSGTIELRGEISARTSLGRLLKPLAVAVAAFPYFTVFLVWWNFRKYLKHHGAESR